MLLSLVLATALAFPPDGGFNDMPVKRFDEPVTVVAVDGFAVDVPPGYYFPQNQFDKMNSEVKRLQAVETEHKNESGPVAVGVVMFLIGVAAGVGVAIAASAR